ncbi:uncharacterized protein LOC144107084 [Amblyomma americanum]
MLAVLLAAALAGSMGGQEEEEKDGEAEDNSNYAGNPKGGGGGKVNPPKKDEVTASTEATSIVTDQEEPSEPTDTTTMESTASTRKPKPFLGLWCTHGPYGRIEVNSSFIFSLCQKLIAQLVGRDFGGEVSTNYGVSFEGIGDALHKKYADYIYWVWFFATIKSYKKNYFERYPLLTYTHLDLRAFGITHITLEGVLQTNHMQLFLDTLGGISADKMVLVIDYYITLIDMPEILDTKKFDGYGHLIVVRTSYEACTFDCLWFDKKYLDFAITLNKVLNQTVAIASTGGYTDADEDDILPGVKCSPWFPRPDDISDAPCKPNTSFTGDFVKGIFWCGKNLFRTESLEGFKSLVKHARSSDLNYVMDDVERLEVTINYTKWDLSFMNPGMIPPIRKVK